MKPTWDPPGSCRPKMGPMCPMKLAIGVVCLIYPYSLGLLLWRQWEGSHFEPQGESQRVIYKPKTNCKPCTQILRSNVDPYCSMPLYINMTNVLLNVLIFCRNTNVSSYIYQVLPLWPLAPSGEFILCRKRWERELSLLSSLTSRLAMKMLHFMWPALWLGVHCDYDFSLKVLRIYCSVKIMV